MISLASYATPTLHKNRKHTRFRMTFTWLSNLLSPFCSKFVKSMTRHLFFMLIFFISSLMAGKYRVNKIIYEVPKILFFGNSNLRYFHFVVYTTAWFKSSLMTLRMKVNIHIRVKVTVMFIYKEPTSWRRCTIFNKGLRWMWK